jgi:hypothetical protein
MPSCGERLVWIILEVLLQNNLSNKQKQGAPLLFSYYSFFQGVALCSFRKEPKGSVLFFGAKKRTKRSIHPNQAFPYMGRM